MPQHDRRQTARKIAHQLRIVEGQAYRRRVPLPPFHLVVTNAETDIAPNTYWGSSELPFRLNTTFHVPPDFGPEIALHLPVGEAGSFSHPEALAHIDGVPLAAVDRHHQEIRLPAPYADGASHALELHGWTGMIDGIPGQPGRQLFMRECAVVEIDAPTRRFVALARNALEAARHLDPASQAQSELLNALDVAFRRIDLREPFAEPFYASIARALDALRGALAAGKPMDAEVIAAGHAHIDVAWLWRLDQTRQKAARTFYTALHLMEQFPNYHFTQSQPQLYEYIRQDHPDLFAAIQGRVREGRWEPIGGMWIEADCNLSGPEALARQFLLGRQFFEKHFGPGAESPVCWLPDVFGFNGSLPQLIRLAGLDYFFTIKLEWNAFNKMPFDTFWWQGIDGTRVLAHFSTSPDRGFHGDNPDLRAMATYNAELSAFTTLGSWIKLKDKAGHRLMLTSYGYGDGGGGPTREMNENAEALAAMPGLPRVRQGRVIDFFRRLEAQSGDTLPTWQGELYFELHRGTYTSQSQNKRANRKAEFGLHDAEFLAAWAALDVPGFEYPRRWLQQAWEMVCLNQFHDILPGSSIGAVYGESLAQYGEVMAACRTIRESALKALRAQIGGDVILANPTAFARDDLAFWEGTLPPGSRFEGEVFTQPVKRLTNAGTLIAARLPAHSLTPLRIVPGDTPVPTGTLYVDRQRLENDLLRVELNAAGDIVRILDKRQNREILPPGQIADQWQAFEDRPADWDAWDIDVTFDEKCYLAEPANAIRIVETGPLRVTLEIHRRILNSLYIQRISLVYNRAQIDFESEIRWDERHILLKTAFPVDLLAPNALYDIPWGHVERPTHRNTSWDWARFEVCGQKWAALREDDYSVALLNDCKYGYDVRDNVLRLSLLRAPTWPDAHADQADHQFAYSLLLQPGPQLDPVVQAGYQLNDPILVTAGDGGEVRPPAPFVQVEGSALVETIKAAEDGRGIILRLYEPYRRRGWITLHAAKPIRAAFVIDLIERDQAALEPTDSGGLRLYLKPFQIVTLRVIFGDEASS